MSRRSLPTCPLLALRGLALALLVLCPGRIQAEETGHERSLAPFFRVEGDSATEQLPLKATSAEIDVAGVIARVRVKQRFENTGTKPIHATYVFPASTQAAVHAMRMRIGERTLEAKIDHREAARRAYEQARDNGQRASLLEQQRPNVFTMNVANVLPRDVIEVELEYSELLTPESGTYELVYPVVVGPRYAGGASPATDAWIANPYLREGEGETYSFDVKVNLTTGIPVRELLSPSHEVDVRYLSPNQASVTLRSDRGGGNRDFVLRYRLSGDAIETGLLVHEGKDERFFTWTMEPPTRVSPSEIPPREYIFLLDVSGSMHGFPLETAKELMHKLLRQLRPSDTFNVALFAGSSLVLHPQGSVQANAANVEAAIARIENERGGGGTELMGGLRAAYAIPKREANVARTVVAITDGYVGVEADAFKLIRENLQAANLFAFGIGSSVNRALIEGMARAGQGAPWIVLRPAEAAAVAERLRKAMASPVLSNVRVRFHGFDAYEVAPTQLPSLMMERPLVVYGKFRGAPRGRIEVTGTTGAGPFSRSIDVATATTGRGTEPLRILWARKWVQQLEDEHQLRRLPDLETGITELGLRYGLLTRFTSFVAVDSEVAHKGTAQSITQPLPLPEGVSNMAVGSSNALLSLRGILTAPPPPAGAAPAAERESAEQGAKDVASPMQKIAVPARMSEQARLRKAVSDWLTGSACAAGAGPLDVRIELDARGRVTDVKVELGSVAAPCLDELRQRLKRRVFSALAGERVLISLQH